MIEENHARQNTDESYGGKNNGPTGYLRGVFIGGTWTFIGLLLTAIFWPNLTERLKFFTANLWVVVTAFAVIGQAVIYWKQREVMEQQWAVMKEALDQAKEQTKIAGDALTLSQAAMVSVHSIRMNREKKSIMLKIENTGNRPAEQIRLFLQVFTFMPPEIGEAGEPIAQETKKSFVREDYGRTKLFKGNLPILLTFYLSEWSDKEFDSIVRDICGLVVDGYIDYSDGFLTQQRTEFFFNYLPEIDAWSAGPADYGDILGRDEDEESE